MLFLLFFHSLSSLRECSRTCLCHYHPTAQLAPSPGAVGDLVTPFVMEYLFDHLCSLLNFHELKSINLYITFVHICSSEQGFLPERYGNGVAARLTS